MHDICLLLNRAELRLDLVNPKQIQSPNFPMFKAILIYVISRRFGHFDLED
jgi:hypothetical protein